MGVNGLWNVIQPCARPTNLATLNQKRLAVDASIWIYQFLKAVRDKEGNALRNSHVVGFFRRICKLLWFGIKPVFVFDGGAPSLKRQTISGRKSRREGRRDDAVRTAGKLLAVQMQRIAEEEEGNRRRRKELEDQGAVAVDEPAEEIPDADKLVYVDELGMDQAEKQKTRRFFKQDAYHLPELDGSIESMGRPEDPRIMSIDQLEEYARQFHSGEDINLYDFSKIDFEGEFFKSLPPADRYNILNAARMRSRLRMGLSKDQLDTMFPDRMAFSRFQIERVKERNHLTQRLMQEAGMTGTDLTLGINSRVAGERDREYILVKNDGAEGGWALGVVSKDRDQGEIHKPIDVDALDFQFQNKDEEQEANDDDDDFEDVPIEGLNRLPRLDGESSRQHLSAEDSAAAEDDKESLFVAQADPSRIDDLFGDIRAEQNLADDEQEDLDQAITLSLRNQHGLGAEAQEEEEAEFEDVPEPEWTQKAVDQPKPVASSSGSMIAHIVNNRANAAVPKRRSATDSDDSDDDFRAALSKARKKKAAPAPKPQPIPAVPNVKNSFGGPLPFEKLDWKASIFAKKPETAANSKPTMGQDMETQLGENDDDEMAGGFERDADDDEDAPKPLPPWMMPDESDIRDSVKARQKHEDVINEADREAALEEEKRWRKEAVIEIESSDDDESDIEVIDAPTAPTAPTAVPDRASSVARMSPASIARVDPPPTNPDELVAEVKDTEGLEEARAVDPQASDAAVSASIPEEAAASVPSSPEPEFEEVEAFQPPEAEVPAAGSDAPPEDAGVPETAPAAESAETHENSEAGPAYDQEIVFGDDDDFSDPEEEELLAQMAEEAEEHARFASQLNNKSEQENQEVYERELKALRTQQKKDRRDADEVTQIMITECQALLRFFGIPYITAPMEAEAQCAELVSLGLVDGIVTDDSDIFLFGGTRVYKNMFNSNKFVELYLGSDLEKELSLSREQLISLAHLLGSDYTEGLPGVGPVTAVEVISEFPGRDGLSDFHTWWQDVQNHGRPKEADQASVFRRKFRKAQGKKLFLPPGFPNPAVFEAYLKPEVDSETDPFQWGVPDVEGLRRFLMATIGWSQDRTDEVLVPVIRDMNRRDREGTQSNITRFFGGAVGVGAKEAFAPRQRGVGNSKRMAQAVNKLRANAVVDQLGPTAGAGAASASAPAPAAGQEDGDNEAEPTESSSRGQKRKKAGRQSNSSKKKKNKNHDNDAAAEEDGE